MFKKGASSRGKAPAPQRRRLSQRTPDDSKDTPRTTPATQFRRNQTLSSYRHNTPEESERQKAHQLASQRRRLGGIFTVVFGVVIALTLLLWQLIAQAHVTTSTKQLSVAFDGSAYEKSVSDYLNIHPAQRLRFALDETALSEYVAQRAPEVERLEMSGFAGIARTNLAITFRTPVAGWQINNTQHYVDAHGVVFEKNYYESPKVQIVDESGINPGDGGAVVGTRLLGFLGRVVAQAQGRGYVVNKATLPVGTTRQVDIHFDTTTTRVKFSIDRGAGEQVEDADRSLRHLKGQNVTAEYIDVRVPGRAAYR